VIWQQITYFIAQNLGSGVLLKEVIDALDIIYNDDYCYYEALKNFKEYID